MAFEWPPPERGETNKLKGIAQFSCCNVKVMLLVRKPLSLLNLEEWTKHAGQFSSCALTKALQGRRSISADGRLLAVAKKKKMLTQSVSSTGEGSCPTARLRGGTLRSDSCCLPLLRPRRSNYHHCFTDAPGVPDAINKLRRSPGIRTVSAA